MSQDASVRDFMFGFNDSTFSDRELIIEILPENATRPESGELQSPEKGDESDCPGSSEGCPKVLEFHVTSLLLAEKSPFFHKLFTNGMMESTQRCVTMRIHASEETAFVELLKYMYNGTLTISSAPALLDLLKLADRFEVISCMRLCDKLLAELPMTIEFALLYVDFTSSTSRTDEVRLLSDATKRFLVDRYKDIDKVRDEIMEMPLDVMEIILSSDVLQVDSEDTMFDLVVKWIETHYPKLEDQRNILSANLGKYIRFPYMSLDKLREVLSCNILDDGFANKAVIDALFFKVKTAPHDHRHSNNKATPDDSVPSNYYHPYIKRDYYKRMPIEVLPCKEIVVNFNLKFDECANFKPEDNICSDPFNFGGHTFYLYAECSGAMKFRVCLLMDKTDYVPFGLRYEFSAKSKGYKNAFRQKNSGSINYDSLNSMTLYETPWSTFVDGESLDSIDGCLFLQVKLVMHQHQYQINQWSDSD